MEIRLLTSPDCPHGTPTEALVRALADDLVAGSAVVATGDAGRATPGFRGSPTILVDGVDLESPDLLAPSDSCRLYPHRPPTTAHTGAPERFHASAPVGVPPRWLVEAGLLRALAPRHVLFLCVANSARSQMAEGIARALAPDGMKVSSAGSEPSRIRPQAVRALGEIGIDASDQRSKGVPEADDGNVDVVITLCEEEVCPAYLGSARRVHWGMPDPAGAGATAEEEMEAFRAVRDELVLRISRLMGRPATTLPSPASARPPKGPPGHS
jgi:arsenate reductase